MRGLLVSTWFAMAWCACSTRPGPGAAEHAALGGGAVARVGAEVIPATLVRDVALAQDVDAPRALELLIEDALAAAGARKTGADRGSGALFAIDAARARLVVQRMRDAALASGPATDSEVNELTAAHWLEVDAPERMRVIHAVVLEPKDHAREPAAKAVAATIEASLAGVADDDFEARVKAIGHEGAEVKVERLDPFVADGRIATRAGGRLDPDFVRGASSLAVGQTSGVVHSAFGWHIIRMIERLPERRVPFDQRRRLFLDEVVAQRARRSLDALLDHLGEQHGVTLANGVDEMMTEATMGLLGGGPGATPPTP